MTDARYVPTRDEIRDARARAYLDAWPLAAQAEAAFERDTGRPEKWERMCADFAAIRARYRYPGPHPGP